MSHPAAAFPFAYRLPTDAAAWNRDAAPRGTTVARRRRLVVLVLTFLALAGGLAAAMAPAPPSGDAESMVRRECIHDPDAGSNPTDDPLLCF